MFLKFSFFIYLLLIILLAILPFGAPVIYLNNFNVQFRLDYLIHVIIYTPWLFLAVSGKRFKIIYAILFGMMLGAGTEIIQYFLTYRTFNINDLIANILGIFLGVIFLFPKPSIFLHKLLRIC